MAHRDLAAPVDITVVLVDDGSETSLDRPLRRLRKSAPTVDVILIAAHSPRVPASEARRILIRRQDEGRDVEAVIRDDARATSSVLVASPSLRLGDAWISTVQERVRTHGSAVSQTSSGIRLYPPGLRNTSKIVRWEPGLQVRGSGGAVEVRVSAVLIVKDEAAVLRSCLEAARPFVDEIVVYDTGSSDATVEIAESCGATVVRGYWNNHFGDARNRALQHATGDWIFQIDADEVVAGDAGSLRQHLKAVVHDHVMVPVASQRYEGDISPLITTPVRLFRRGSSAWVGALHEYPAPLAGAPFAGVATEHAPLRLVHSGYQEDVVLARDKRTRNTALAQAELAVSVEGDDRAALVSNLGRSLIWAGQVDEGLGVLEELRTLSGNAPATVLAARQVVDILTRRDDIAEIEEWLDLLEANGESPGNLAVYRARRLLSRADATGARAALATVRTSGGGADIWSVAFDDQMVTHLDAQISLHEGNWDLAVRCVDELLDRASDLAETTLVLTAYTKAGRALSEVVERASDAWLQRSLRDAMTMNGFAALNWIDAYRVARADDPRPLVAGSVIASRMDWQTALQWSLYVREAGLDSCPLQVMGSAADAHVLDRAMALTVLAEVFADLDAGQELSHLRSSWTPEVDEHVGHLSKELRQLVGSAAG